ncbi:U-scoloptoxin(01)-Er1a-like [Centruroides vittatus]|uniref:U-scoloptoxin(01)-Er1a-like n=1 Tax=Centruroides vittatus TaxID=120091 RepID=UPI0035103AC7
MFNLIPFVFNLFALIYCVNAEVEEKLPYPTYSYIPETEFDCRGRWGFYADPGTDCQVFHLCKYGPEVSASFLCTNGTLFQQIHPQRCDHWYKVKCH